jgi:site-specific DNA recombinase
VLDRKLVINEAEAETVRKIYRSDLVLGSVRLLKEQLAIEGVRGKARRNGADENDMWGRRVPLARGAIYTLLQNRLYRGEITHKDAVYRGEHPAIIDEALWDAVQQQLATNRAEQASGTRAASPSLLVGPLRDEAGQGFTPTHAVKNGKRYRYYVSSALITGNREASPKGRRIPASDLEQIVVQRFCAFLTSEPAVFEALQPHQPDTTAMRQALDRAAQVGRDWTKLMPSEQRLILRTLLAGIAVYSDRVELHLRPTRLAGLTGSNVIPSNDPPTSREDREAAIILLVPVALRRAGMAMKLLVEGTGAVAAPDPSLIRLLARAQDLWGKLQRTTLMDLAASEKLTTPYVTRVVRLAFLAPDLTSAILAGRQPAGLTAAQLLLDTRLPLAWQEQREFLRFGAPASMK